MLNNKLLVILLSAIIPLNFSTKLYSMNGFTKQKKILNPFAQSLPQLRMNAAIGAATSKYNSGINPSNITNNNRAKYLLGVFTLGVSAFGLKKLYSYYKDRINASKLIAEDVKDIKLDNFKNYLSNLTSSLTHDQWAQYQDIHNVINQALEGNFTLIQDPLFFSILNNEQQVLVTEAIKSYNINII